MCTEINTYALVMYTGREHASFTLFRQRELINFYFLNMTHCNHKHVGLLFGDPAHFQS